MGFFTIESKLKKIMHKDSGQTFDHSFDSLEAISERLLKVPAVARYAMRRGTPVSYDYEDGKLNMLPSAMTGGYFLAGGSNKANNNHRSIAVLSSTLVVMTTAYECVAGSIDSYGVVTWGTPVTHTAGYTSYGLIPVNTATFIQIGKDTSNYPCARVGTISGTTITFGGSWTVAKSTAFSNIDGCKLDTDKFVIVYTASGASAGYARAATISGYTITYGTEATVQATGYSTNFSCCGQVATDAFVVSYTAQTTGYATSVACTVSGTTITVGGAPTTHNASVVSGFNCTDATDGSMVLGYKPSTHGWIVAMTVSGTTITAGSPVDQVSTTGVESCSPYYEYGDTSIVHIPWLLSGCAVYGRYTRSGTTLTLDSMSSEAYTSWRASSTASFGHKALATRKCIFCNSMNGAYAPSLGLGASGATPIMCVGDSYLTNCNNLVGFLIADVAASDTGVAVLSGLFAGLDLATFPSGYKISGYILDSPAMVELILSAVQPCTQLGRFLSNDTLIVGEPMRDVA